MPEANLPAAARRFRELRKNIDGNVGLFFALSLIPLMAMVALTVDYSRALSANGAMRVAADSAALTAAAVAQQELAASKASWNSDAVTAGSNAFKAISIGDSSVSATPTVSIAQSASGYTATVSFTGSYQTSFMSAPFGLLKSVGSIPLSGSVTATFALGDSNASGAGYTDVHIVIDNSTSMGIGATIADQQLMQNTIGCVVACHYTDIYGDVDNVATAHAAHATLRLDSVIQAVSNILNQIKIGNANSTYRVALYTMSNSLTTIHALDTNISGAISDLANVQLAGVGGKSWTSPAIAGQGGTNVSYSLKQLNALLATAGTGASASSRKGVVIVATDAVQDSTYEYFANSSATATTVKQDPNWISFSPSQTFTNFGGNPIEEGFDYSACTPIKNKNYRMISWQVNYLIPSSSTISGLNLSSGDVQRFSYISNTLSANNSSAMLACASSAADYYASNYTADILTASASVALSIAPARVRLTK